MDPMAQMGLGMMGAPPPLMGAPPAPKRKSKTKGSIVGARKTGGLSAKKVAGGRKPKRGSHGKH